MSIRTYGDSIMDNALCRIPLYTKNRGSNPRLPIRCNFLREISRGKNFSKFANKECRPYWIAIHLFADTTLTR